MVVGVVLKCILLAKFHVEIVETPISEYAMASMSKVHNEVQFEATVIEGRMNSISIEYPGLAKTMSYSSDYEQRTMASKLDFKEEHASIDCEII